MRKVLKIVRNTLLLFLFFLLFLLLAGTIVFFSVTSGVTLNTEALSESATAVHITDRSGAILADISAGGKETVAAEEIPDHVKQAFVATEDKRFYAHRGVDPKRMLKAAYKNLLSRSFKEGASTISQQLVKNTQLSGEKTLSRKMKEIRLTFALEKLYSKDEILGCYLNAIYFGHSAFGIGNASDFYFHKPVSELTVAEGAMLAGVIPPPNRYSPFVSPTLCKARRDLVLKNLFTQGYIDAATYEDALSTPLPTQSSACDKPYLDLVYAELGEIMERERLTIEQCVQVRSYIDPSVQALLEGLPQAECDRVYAVIGNEDCGVKGYYSTCGNIVRSPASAIKPLAVYAPALEENLIFPCTPIPDKKTDFNGYSPSDYGGETGGYLSAKEALAKSANIPAVHVLNALGTERSCAYLQKLGIAVPAEDMALTLALGAMQRGTDLLTLCGGYTAFANYGLYRAPRFIAEITDGNGKPLYTAEPHSERVFAEDTAQLMNGMLEYTAKSGTAKALRSLPFAVCAKTGTGGTNAGNTDAYTLAYTTQDTVGAWYGNRNNEKITMTGGGIPCRTVKRILESLYPERFPEPFRENHIATVRIDKSAYTNAQRILLADPIAPVCSVLFTKCKKSYPPTERSDYYSHPTVKKPTLQYDGERVTICMEKNTPFRYRIFRQCGDEEYVMQDGAKTVFCDTDLMDECIYEYTVIPYYRAENGKEYSGKAIRLPKVTTKKERIRIPERKHSITEKPWWE